MTIFGRCQQCDTLSPLYTCGDRLLCTFCAETHEPGPKRELSPAGLVACVCCAAVIVAMIGLGILWSLP